jgi:hypothetical protein
MPSTEATPQCVAPSPYESFSLQGIRLSGVSITAGRHHQNTFDVTPKHTALEDGSRGVRFNVETVPGPLPQDLKKPRISRQEELTKIRERLIAAHTQEGYGNKVRNVRMEATSEHDPNLIYQGGNGFIVAVVTAFAQHLPLQMAPDHIWALITYAFAKHVDQHPEELRHKFVSHQGKQRIGILTPPSFQMSHDSNPDTGATSKEWEQSVFAQFSTAIQGYIGDKTHAALVADFSSTTPASKAASEVVLMAAMKNYFSFGMGTMCGIPEITLLGTEQDWIALRQRAEALGKLMMPEFEEYWMPALLPVLDKFVESYQGRVVDHGFWQSMVKLRHNGMGSGYSEFISGWVQILFPHLGYSRDRGRQKETKQTMRQWNEMYFLGPDPKKFPLVESFAPCDWNYFGITYDLEFHAGITGVSQDPETGRLSPVTGWYVAHSMPKPNAVRIEEVEKEIQDLHRGHKKDFELGYRVYKDQAWYHRIQMLSEELEALKYGARSD